MACNSWGIKFNFILKKVKIIMSIIHNGQVIPDSTDILLEKWKLKSVTGEKKPEKPGFCAFNNIVYGLDLLRKHIINNSKIALHTDVDVDGIGTTYIMKKTLEHLGSNQHILVINKDKDHGIQQKHALYFNKNKIDLIIITDSSSNEIETIKMFNCDVLCIDHHELTHNDLLGYCNDGKHRYVIINNTIDNKNFGFDKGWLKQKNVSAFNNIEEYKGTQDMSCGLVVYELLRIYCECFDNPKLLENLMLYEWVGVTLITDVINTLNDRNQWYLNQTVFNNDTEHTLKVMLNIINKYKATLDKSYIQYTFAPLINKAIRADKGSHALNIIINEPNNILELNKYKKLQEDAIDKACYYSVTRNINNEVVSKNPKVFTGENIQLNIGELNINKNYSGVIASKLSGDNNKNAAVFIINDKGLCKGSFRGKYKEVDYRKYFDNYSDDIYAQGHPGAFGFELTKEQLDYLMSNIKSIEPTEDPKPWLTLGNMKPEEYGVYHIIDFNKFKQQGYLWKIATGNSKVTSKDEIVVRVKACDVVLKSTKGKILIYDVFGMECKAFKPLAGEYFDIYMEYTNEINIFIK